MSTGTRVAIGALIGTGVGVLTSFGQAGLDLPWSSLVNSASPWLAGAFVAGVLQARMRTAALVGLAACVLEVTGYYMTTVARGYPVSTTEIVFWSACAVIGGPIFGAGGYAYRRPIGAALLPAAFLAEAVGAYAISLHYWSTVWLYVVIGMIVAVVLGQWVRPLSRYALWLIVLTTLGIVGEWALSQAGSMAFR